MRDIDYRKITDYYSNIISYILNNLSYTGLKYNTEGIHTNHTKEEYEAEYLNAYGYLERAEWRLSEVKEMKDFYNEHDFFYFGLENLSSARHRIQHYLEDTDWNIFEDLDYKQYDELVIDYYQPIRLTDDEELRQKSSTAWKYYWELNSTAMVKQYLLDDCDEIIKRISEFKEYLDNEDYNVLSANQEILDSFEDCTSLFLVDIPCVPFKKK